MATLLVAAGLFVFYHDYVRQREYQETLFQERGSIVLDALAAGLRAQTRMGRYRGEYLSAVFEELAKTPGVVRVCLTDPDNQLVAEGGMTVSESAAMATCTQSQPVILAGRPSGMEPDRGLGGGRQGGNRWGRGGPEMDSESVPWNQGEYELEVYLDEQPLAAAVHREQLMHTAAALAYCVVVMFAAAFYIARNRQQRLQTDLMLAKEKTANLETLALLGAGLAHETKNPLGSVRGLAQNIAGTPGLPVEVRQKALAIVDEADRTVGEINMFLTLARPKTPRMSSVALAPLFEQLTELVKMELPDVNVSFETGDLTVMADRDLLRQSLLNLGLNAVQACRKECGVVFEAQRQGEAITIRVKDDGAGIPPEDLPKVVQPYFTRRKGGTGLGLALVSQIAQAHGWRLHINSTLGQGTCASLTNIQPGMPAAST